MTAPPPAATHSPEPAGDVDDIRRALEAPSRAANPDYDRQTAIMDALPHACTIGSIDNWRKAADEYERGLEARGYTIVPTPAPGVSGETREAVAKALWAHTHGEDAADRCTRHKWAATTWRVMECPLCNADAVLAALAPGPECDWFLAPDGGDEPTLWMRTDDPDAPLAVLCRFNLPEKARHLWPLTPGAERSNE